MLNRYKNGIYYTVWILWLELNDYLIKIWTAKKINAAKIKFQGGLAAFGPLPDFATGLGAWSEINNFLITLFTWT